jgi:PAS domain S-box-containing protein
MRAGALGDGLLAAAEAAGIGVWVARIGEGARVLHVSEVLATLVGSARDAIASGPWLDFVDAVDRERIDTLRAAGSATRIEGTLVTASGERVPVGIGLAFTEADGERLDVLLFTDLRDRKAVAARLSTSERRFHDVLAAIPDGVVISRELGIVFANAAAEKLLGLPSGGLLGRSLGEFLDRGEVERMRARLALIARGEGLPPAIYRARRADGELVHAEITSIIVEHDGTRAVLAVARDVTERVNLQASFERTERLAALGRLSAGMAHEINNPLAFVSLSAEALARRLGMLAPPGPQREEMLGLLDNVSRGTGRVAAIVRDLKTFSRDAEGERGPVDLESVISQSTRMVRHEIAARGTLATDVPALPPVLGEPRKLEQVFVNLLMNALQALPEGRGGHVTIRALVEERHVTIDVEDDGSGIASEHLGRIFDPFFTTKPVGVGTGLGLSICHGIVTGFGGDISVVSEVGRGTTVRVRLLRTSARATGPEPIASITRAPRRGRVLVVEDQAPLAKTLARALADQHDVSVVNCAADAITRLSSADGVFDVIVCDMLMPDGTGADVFERVTARRPELAARFVFMTGGAFVSAVSDFLDRVPNARLDKPFPLPLLEEAIARVLAEGKEPSS